MSIIPQRLLVSVASVQRASQTATSTGDMSQTLTTVLSNVLIRVTLNDRMITYGRTGEQGENVVVSHIGFVLPTSIIVKGDFVTVGLEQFKVLYVEDNPGGITGHHKELYLERVE